MVEIKDVNYELLRKAIRAWSGYDIASYPLRKESALVGVLPEINASKIMPIIAALENEFYKSDAYLTAPSISEMGALASKDFKNLYPDLPDDVSEVFAWCYTYDNK